MVMEENYRTLLLKFNDDYQGARKVYFAEHKTSTPSVEKPLGRTLFVTCVPPWVTAENLREIFSQNGPVQNVFLEKRPNPGPTEYEDEGMSRLLYQLPDNRVGFGFKYAYVVFKSATGMRNAMKVMDLSEPRVTCTSNNLTSTGVVKWREEYNCSIIKESDIPQLQQEIKEFTENFDREKDEIVRKAEEEAEPDEDGWVTVSRHTSKKPVVTRSLKTQTRLKAVAERKRKKKELANFYKFQMKEEKLKRIDDLKSKFEADKQKQLKMKQDRKFKPY